MKNMFRKFIVVISFFCLTNAFAASSPVSMLQQATDQMLSELKATSNRSASNLYRLVDRILVPHVDLDYMSELVTGRYWSQATPAQRNQFKSQFTRYVTQTYSAALASYTNETVEYFPSREGARNCPPPKQGNTCTRVKSKINRNNGEPISVTYNLINAGGTWQIYNFNVEGVSIVENYRSQFADILRKEGFDGLLQKLSSRAVN